MKKLEKRIMDTKKLYLFYFVYGVIASVATQMLPLVMKTKGFDASKITVILTVVFLAALFQPFVGHQTKTRFGSKNMLYLLVAVIVVTGFTIFMMDLYIPMILIVLVFSIARSSISPIYDSYTTIAAKKYNINYGLVRSGASLGFGLGMAIFTLIASILDLDYPSSFAFVSILGIIAILIVRTLPDERTQADDKVEEKSKTDLLGSILLIAMYVLYFGGLSIRMSYLSMYYVEFGYTTSFISLTTFAMVIPEIIFLPLYNVLFARFNKLVLLCCSILLGIMQMTMYILFTANPLLLIFASLFNGFQIMLFFPTFFGMLQDTLGEHNSSFGFVMNMTMQSLFVGIFNLIVIRPIIIEYNSIIPVYMVVICLQLAAFVPVIIMHYNYRRTSKIN